MTTMSLSRPRLPAVLRRPTAVGLGVGMLAAFALVALLAPWIATHDPNRQELLNGLAGPSSAHWFGTDALGRDVFSRIVYGTRYELAIALPAVLVALAVALPFGLAAGYHGRWVDRAISTVSEALLTFPSLVVAIVLMAVLGTGTWPLLITLVVTQTPQMIRYIRGFAVQVAAAPYVLAARAAGTRTPVILLRHVLRNVAGPLLVVVSLFASEAVLVIAALGFLGIGVQPPTPEWGTMLSEGKVDFVAHPHLMIFPGLAIALLILAFNVVGDALRDRMDTGNLRTR